MTSHEKFLRGQGGSRAILRFVDSTGLRLARRMLNDVDFTGSDLSGGVFAGCHLERASLYCADLSGCDLRASNLKRGDLRGACLMGATLNGAVLDEADMRAAYVAIADGRGGMQMRWRPGPAGRRDDAADFTNAAMRGVRLRGANLKGANFAGANLDGADFAGAKLTDAVFHGAIMTGVALGDLALTAAQLAGCVVDPGPEALARMPQIAAMLREATEWVESDGIRGAPGVLDGEDLRPLAGALQFALGEIHPHAQHLAGRERTAGRQLRRRGPARRQLRGRGPARRLVPQRQALARQLHARQPGAADPGRR